MNTITMKRDIRKRKARNRGRFEMTVLTTEKKFDLSIKDILEDKLTETKSMKKSLWKIIAKNEIRLRTSWTRNHRILFFVVLYGVLGLWAFIFAPLLFDLFIPTLASQFSDVFKPVVAILIESFMMTLFLILIVYPLNNIYKGEDELGSKETLLATPVKVNDIFLGEFLGKAPIYTIAVLIFAPIVIGMVNPIVDLTFVQYLVIYGTIFVFVYFANLVGSIMVSWIEHKISKSEKARELGKILIWIITIAMVATMYAVMFFLNELMAHPELKNWLAFYPSLWFSNIILYSIDATLIEPFILNIWINILLATGVPVATLYISYKKAESFYTLEGGIEKSSITIVKHENIFYRFIRLVSGHKYGSLTVMQLKRFFRKKSNIARIAYVVGLLGFMTWFMSRMDEDGEALIMTSSMLIMLGGAMSSIILGHLIFIDSKDIVWVYKRSPRGIKGAVNSYLIMMFILSIIITIFTTILRSFFITIDIIETLIFFFLFLANMEICMLQAVGLQCRSPAFGEKDSNMKGNAMISMLIMQPVIFAPMFLLIVLHPNSMVLARLILLGPVFLYNLAIGIPLMYIGMKKLNKLE